MGHDWSDAAHWVRTTTVEHRVTLLPRAATLLAGAMFLAGCGAEAPTIGESPISATGTPRPTVTAPSDPAEPTVTATPFDADEDNIAEAVSTGIADGSLCPVVGDAPLGTGYDAPVQDDPMAGTFDVTPLRATSVVVVVCGTHAHQSEIQLATWNGTVLTPLWIEVPDPTDRSTLVPQATIGGTATVRPDGSVAIVSRYRGLGDCGMAIDANVRVVADGRLTTEQVRERTCDVAPTTDGHTADVSTWPVIHPVP